MKLDLRLDLGYNRRKPWLYTENGVFSGVVFRGEDMLSRQELLDALQNIKTPAEATDFVKTLNGHFAMALELDGRVFLAADRQRTIPLFYKVQGDHVLVYDHVSLADIRTHGLHTQALEELDNCLFVSGNKTLACGVFSVMAGETVTFTEAGVSRQYYFSFDFPKTDYPVKEALFRQMDETFTHAAKRLIAYLDGRCAVVPLSGGHDSRLVVYYLKKLGYDNIVTYTYGPKGNPETTTSEQVAKYLGLPWHFVEYEPKKLQDLFCKEFEPLVDYFSNGVSSVCVQDWYAVDFLHKSGVLPEDAVFVPGHSFDCIAGSFILPGYVQNETRTKQQLFSDILWKHYSEGQRILSSHKKAYYEALIESQFPENTPEILSCDRAFNLYQDYNLRERQAKYICTQPKLYEYYGYDWYLPLWDKELIDFWETIDIRSKYNRTLFFEFTRWQYGDLMDAAPVADVKDKTKKKVNMNPVVRLVRKISQLVHYVDFHYCLAYFTRLDVWSLYLRKRILNIGFYVNQKIVRLLKKRT